jgi:hypothetical protein
MGFLFAIDFPFVSPTQDGKKERKEYLVSFVTWLR